MKKVCPQCNTEFSTYNREQVRCSKRCMGDNMRGAKHRRWKGGRARSYDGYTLVRVGDRYVLEHRLIMEALLGRPLSAEEVVHRRDGDRGNNDPANLVVTVRRRRA